MQKNNLKKKNHQNMQENVYIIYVRDPLSDGYNL